MSIDSTTVPAAYRMQQGVAAVVRILDRCLYLVASCLLVFLVVALFLQVLFRYVIEAPLAWTEEGARFGLVWLSMLSAALAAREGQHFVFRWATLVLPASARFVLRRIIDVLVIFVLVILLRESIFYLEVVAHRTASGTGINLRIPYAGISVGLSALLVIYIADLMDGMLSLITGQTLSEREQAESRIYGLLQAPADDTMEGPRQR
jgi:TRAP-type C4-dicarboxylate transport system permease small subunit